ncbi:MAG: FAD-dependent oxidoreductase [Pirellulales bacterium]
MFPTSPKTSATKPQALVWEAGAAAIDLIESIVTELKADCDFHRVPGYLCAPLSGKENKTGKQTALLRRDAETARRLGFPATLVESVPYFNVPGIRFPDQAKFHPLKYLTALADFVQGDGSDVFEHSEVDKFDADPQRLHVGDVVVEAANVVIATHVPLTGNNGTASACSISDENLSLLLVCDRR